MDIIAIFGEMVLFVFFMAVGVFCLMAAIALLWQFFLEPIFLLILHYGSKLLTGKSIFHR